MLLVSVCLTSVFISSLWDERRLRVFGGVTGLFWFAISVALWLAINTGASVSTLESTGSTSDMDHEASAMKQGKGYNLKYELLGR